MLYIFLNYFSGAPIIQSDDRSDSQRSHAIANKAQRERKNSNNTTNRPCKYKQINYIYSINFIPVDQLAIYDNRTSTHAVQAACSKSNALVWYRCWLLSNESAFTFIFTQRKTERQMPQTPSQKTKRKQKKNEMKRETNET